MNSLKQLDLQKLAHWHLDLCQLYGNLDDLTQWHFLDFNQNCYNFSELIKANFSHSYLKIVHSNSSVHGSAASNV